MALHLPVRRRAQGPGSRFSTSWRRNRLSRACGACHGASSTRTARALKLQREASKAAFLGHPASAGADREQTKEVSFTGGRRSASATTGCWKAKPSSLLLRKDLHQRLHILRPLLAPRSYCKPSWNLQNHTGKRRAQRISMRSAAIHPYNVYIYILSLTRLGSRGFVKESMKSQSLVPISSQATKLLLAGDPCRFSHLLLSAQRVVTCSRP